MDLGIPPEEVQPGYADAWTLTVVRLPGEKPIVVQTPRFVRKLDQSGLPEEYNLTALIDTVTTLNAKSLRNEVLGSLGVPADKVSFFFIVIQDDELRAVTLYTVNDQLWTGDENEVRTKYDELRKERVTKRIKVFHAEPPPGMFEEQAKTEIVTKWLTAVRLEGPPTDCTTRPVVL